MLSFKDFQHKVRKDHPKQDEKEKEEIKPNTPSKRDFKIKTMNEAQIDPEHEYRADVWDHHGRVDADTQEKIEKVMGGAYNKVIIPLEHHVEHDPDVSDHLEKHGWKIDDYHAGTAKKTKMVGNPENGIPMREKTVSAKIGKVLNETNAPDHIKNAFANDPVRSAINSHQGKLSVWISTHPHAIAGMSTNQHWSRQSCMRMKNCQGDTEGEYSEKLQDDSENGTHVAFLVHSDDVHGTHPKAAIARIAMKPYHSEEDGDTIFRPERKTYGVNKTAFSHTVDKWATENYPAKEGHWYQKNESVYDDTNNDTYKQYGKDEIHEMLASGKSVAGANTDVDNKTVGHVMDWMRSNSGDQARRAIEANRSLPYSPSQVRELYNHDSIKDQSYAKNKLGQSHGDKFTGGMIEDLRQELAKNGRNDGYLPNKVLGNPRLPAKVVDNLHIEDLPKVHPSLVKPHHLDKVIDGYENGVSGSLLFVSDNVDRFNGKQLERLGDLGLKYGNENHVMTAYKSPKVSDAWKMVKTDHAFEYGTLQQKDIAMTHSPVITPDHIESVTHPDKIKHMAERIGIFNKNVSDATLTAIKNKVVGLQPDDFSKVHINERIGDKFTHDDVKTIVDNHLKNETRYAYLNSRLPEKLSDRVMDHIEDRMAQHHDQIEELYEDGKEDTPEWEHHGKILQKLMNTHGSLMWSHFNNHIDAHVKRDEAASWANFDESKHDKLLNRYHEAYHFSNGSNHPMVSGIVQDGDTDHNAARGDVEDHREDIKSEMMNR